MTLFFVSFLVLLITGVPISISIGASAVLGCLQLGYPMMVIGQKMVTGIDSYLLIAIPLFISEGDHLKNDIPPKIHLTDGIREGTFKQNGREITVKYCFPIGSDYRLTQLIAAKIRKYDY